MDFAGVWSLWQLILPTLYLYPLPRASFSMKSVKNFWGHLNLKSFIGNHVDPQVAGWSTEQLLVLNNSILSWETHQIQQNPPSPANIMLPQTVCSSRKETHNSFNCFPGCFRFNLTKSLFFFFFLTKIYQRPNFLFSFSFLLLSLLFFRLNVHINSRVPWNYIFPLYCQRFSAVLTPCSHQLLKLNWKMSPVAF